MVKKTEGNQWCGMDAILVLTLAYAIHGNAKAIKSAAQRLLRLCDAHTKSTVVMPIINSTDPVRMLKLCLGYLNFDDCETEVA